MMTVFVASCVATVRTIYLSVALATSTCVPLACHYIVVPYRTEWFVHRYIGVPILRQFCCYLVRLAALPCYQTGGR